MSKKNHLMLSFFAMFFILLSSAIYAQDTVLDLNMYYTIDEQSIVTKVLSADCFSKEVEDKSDGNNNANPCSELDFIQKRNEIPKSIDIPIEVIISNIINIGKQLWTIVEAGRPVVNVQNEYATAVAQGINNWMQLDLWKTSFSKVYQVTAKNLYRMEVVKFSYKIIWTYGGSYKGVGQYLTNVSILPIEVNALWGYTFASQVRIPNVVNVGTNSDPIAGMQLDLHWDVRTPIKVASGENSYFIRGDGPLREL
ncbi:MAG: hypothetical protein HQK53_12560 [Oligoflexia bacterium]|nr:hypothetical protein [Oligoflexia bacterium]